MLMVATRFLEIGMYFTVPFLLYKSLAANIFSSLRIHPCRKWHWVPQGTTHQPLDNGWCQLYNNWVLFLLSCCIRRQAVSTEKNNIHRFPVFSGLLVLKSGCCKLCCVGYFFWVKLAIAMAEEDLILRRHHSKALFMWTECCKFILKLLLNLAV